MARQSHVHYDVDGTVVDFDESGYRLERRGLACAGRSQNDEEFTVCHVEVDTVDAHGLSVVLRQCFDSKCDHQDFTAPNDSPRTRYR